MSSQRGFSFIELAVVLIVAALIASALFGGYKLIIGQKVKRVMEDISVVADGIRQFKEHYGNYPGDMWNATAVFGGGVSNGNGDGVVDRTQATSESLYAWQHLKAAGYVEGVFDGTTHVGDGGMMAGVQDHAAYGIRTVSGQLRVIAGVQFDANNNGIVDIAGESERALLTPREAWGLDDAYDDGDPDTGKLLGVTGNSASGSCVSGGVYDFDNGGVACVIHVLVD